MVCRTSSSKWLLIPRLAGGGLLVMAAVGHLIDHPDAFRALLEQANVPLSSLNATVGPVVEIAAGLMLVLGFLARIGGVLAIGAMSVALYVHTQVSGDTWPIEGGEPPAFMATIPMMSGLLVVFFGAGGWSIDRAMCGPRPSSA